MTEKNGHRHAQDDVETLVPCPWCEGHGMVSADKRAEWREAYPEIAKKPDEVA